MSEFKNGPKNNNLKPEIDNETGRLKVGSFLLPPGATLPFAERKIGIVRPDLTPEELRTNILLERQQSYCAIVRGLLGEITDTREVSKTSNGQGGQGNTKTVHAPKQINSYPLVIGFDTVDLSVPIKPSEERDTSLTKDQGEKVNNAFSRIYPEASTELFSKIPRSFNLDASQQIPVTFYDLKGNSFLKNVRCSYRRGYKPSASAEVHGIVFQHPCKESRFFLQLLHTVDDKTHVVYAAEL